MSSANVHELNDATFASEALDATVPVVVDLWAPWCGPCKMLTPILEDLAEEYADSIKVVKINVDESPSIATKYNVVSIPTLLFIKNGEVVDQHVGLLARGPLQQKIDKLLA
jgi:thioredoxin 1